MKKNAELLKNAGLTLGSILAIAFAPIFLVVLVIWVAVYLEIKG